MPGDTSGLDIDRLKRMVVAMWREGGGNTLVKVSPKGTTPDVARMIGYCTTIKYIVGRTPEEMERLLGFLQGSRLNDGAEIFRIDPLPSPSQFALRGYTQTPAGVAQVDGKVVDPRFPPGEGVPQWELTGYPQSGLQWLARVLPMERFVCRYDSLPGNVAVFMPNS